AIEKNEFRQDLYFRLNVAVISLPPLRERKEDIPLLVDYFIERYGAELGSATSKIDDEAVKRIHDKPWRGNVRELLVVVRIATLLAHGYKITSNIVRRALEQTKPSRAASHGPFAAQIAAMLTSAQAGERENAIEDLTDLVERELYTQAFRRAKRDQSKAAKWL